MLLLGQVSGVGIRHSEQVEWTDFPQEMVRYCEDPLAPTPDFDEGCILDLQAPDYYP